jgi:hypothetical protein
MPGGGPEPLPVEAPPGDDLDAVGAVRQRQETGPGAEPGGGDVEGGGGQPLDRHGGGQGGQRTGEIGVRAREGGKHPRPRPGRQGQGGAVGQGGQPFGLQ